MDKRYSTRTWREKICWLRDHEWLMVATHVLPPVNVKPFRLYLFFLKKKTLSIKKRKEKKQVMLSVEFHPTFFLFFFKTNMKEI
jgi:hypothetical protein